MRAGALLSTGQVDGVEAHLRDAERWLDGTPEEARSAGIVVVDEAEFHRLPGAIAVHRASELLTVGRQVDPSLIPGFDYLLSFKWPAVVYALDVLAWDSCFGLALLLVQRYSPVEECRERRASAW